jgi:type II secretory pathway component GspD/PulD (secretin)
VADTTNNALVITDVQTRIDQIEQFVKGLDIRTPQVSIQAKIILVDRTDVQSLGLQYDLGSPTQFFNKLVSRLDSTGKPFTPDQTIVDLGGNSLSAIGNADQQVINPALKLIFSTALGNFTLTTFVQALQSVDLADVQAEPSVTTLDNRPAEVLVGDRVPIRIIDVSSQAGQTNAVPRATVSFQQTGINLRVTPHVTANRQILMQLHAERSAVKPASVDIGFTFQTQQADAQVLVSDGETIVMGGLTETDLTLTKSGIPFLVDLPIVGRLFGFTSQTEERRDLIILITPHIVDDLAAPASRSN